jgi:C4-dicarboxylate-specific signal transduction histidine kinase
MSSVVDITVQKQLEMRQRQQDEQLQHVQRREIMSEMASTLAHEISQPLTAIGANTSAAKLFADQGDLPQLKATLEKIGQQKVRASEIVKAIKDHTRKKTLGAELCDINRIVQNVLSFLEPEAHRRKVVVRYFPGANIPAIQGDRVLIEQVLSNLVINSLQSMPDQSGSEKVVEIKTVESDNLVKVRVSDNGTGIAEEIAGQLFKNFVTTKEKGLGIGLSICRTIIEQHGGRLIFESRPSGGTVFQFELPCTPIIPPV